jgi:hypothetical protein
MEQVLDEQYIRLFQVFKVTQVDLLILLSLAFTLLVSVVF